jgi:prepilin-type N-terminal cleavage/methylation domain-containing protein
MRIEGKKFELMKQQPVRSGLSTGFTLTEMMIVMAIIAILTGLTLGALPAINEKRVRTRLQAELSVLTAAIENYKEKHGSYPPDNPNNLAQSPLFYELVGARAEQAGGGPATYYPLNGAAPVAEATLNTLTGNKGIINSATEESEVKNFLPALKPSQYGPSAYSPDAIVLRVPAKGVKDGAVGTDETNAWKYVVGKPNAGAQGVVYSTNNPNTYDLWAEARIGSKTVVIGNWRK